MADSRLPILFSVEEVADILNIGRSTVFRLIKENQIESIKLGRTRRIHIDAMQKLVNDLINRSAIPNDQ